MLQVITIFGIGRVKVSNDSKYKEGDLVLSASLHVAEYCVIPATEIFAKIDAASGISLPDYLSSLGGSIALLSLHIFNTWVSELSQTIAHNKCYHVPTFIYVVLRYI